ncbi:MAG: NADH-quinone oxidoreductase subunit L [Ilumatobacter sp.]|uniref:NADH-quinone oxidoreductase subunit L n=1 Tax=Ilumatobacter sp. TaxID=1967498 RepID=UPI002620FE5B|nr:NADH-quinone oxidoreductase subunit L [Ilumatobacter sp.]MDJ0770775.1 NADH-quinone oxidoreductase subunit L [Ilumatobacter sp.]
MLDVVWLIPAFPLAGFVLILLFGRRLGEPRSGYLAATMVLGSFVVAAGAYFDLLSMDEEERSHIETLFSWVPVSSLQIDMAFLADPLSITMALFVTGVGFLIHLFAIGYMHGDANFSKFFLYLNLFILSMTLLVLGENLLVTFLGWEGVGTCSYLLISFWHQREPAATAGKKAFVTNRVGDWGFMLAMFLGFEAVGSVSYGALNGAAEEGLLATSTATGIALLLFVGAVGKSAQLPLYLWLPDAMEGPTPVSALIHAATMVTAGVFLMTRMNPMLAAAAPEASTIIAWVGAITALFAATIAVAQTDIKRVLAYSTVSQLGYMFLAVGSGAFVAAIFHMVTHAFFKALMFLGSGSVIHGMHEEQDMRRMGALRKFMPVTAFTFIIGWLAIAGVPPFAGFWSKDEILLFTLAERGPALYIIGIVTAVLTAFYMTRQVIMVFFGEAKWTSHANEDEVAEGDEEHAQTAHGEFKPHESPPIMLLPLVVLAGLSIVGGVIQLPSFGFIPKDWRHKLEDWLHPVVEAGEAKITETSAYDAKELLALLAVACAVAGIAAAYAIYARKVREPVEPQILADGWKYDSTVSAFMGGPGRRVFDAVAWVDRTVVDGAVNGVGRLVSGTAGEVRKVQSGNVRNYAGVLGVGVVLLLGWFVIGRGVL